MIDVAIENKTFPGAGTVISELSFSINAGELVTLIGPSGAGKSTLLNLICGLDQAFAGQIKARTCEGGRARIGLMFQEPRLMPWLTIAENVNLVADNPSHSRTRTQALLEMVGLADCADRYPGHLSGGMKKRAALARAFMPEPDILLMDEPFASLDAPSAEELRGKLLALWQEQNTTVLYVTHSLKEAISLSDRILFLSNKPMGLVLQKPVDIDRPRAIGGEKVTAFHQRLLTQHPELLAGYATLEKDLESAGVEA